MSWGKCGVSLCCAGLAREVGGTRPLKMGEAPWFLGCFQGLDLRGHERNQINKKSYILFFKRHCSGEQAPALRNKKDNFYFILFILLTAKVYQNPSLKIFALAACRYALFLLSANIYQTTLFGQEGIVLSFVTGYWCIMTMCCGSLARDFLLSLQNLTLLLSCRASRGISKLQRCTYP